MNDQEIATTEARETLKSFIIDLIRASWNATKFMEGDRRSARQRELRTLWADKRLVSAIPVHIYFPYMFLLMTSVGDVLLVYSQQYYNAYTIMQKSHNAQLLAVTELVPI